MRKNNILNYTFYIMLALMIGLASCTKEGPAGPAGADGTNGQDGAPGADGEDGIDGQDGTATCIECHDNSQVSFAKTNQWESSVHAMGGNFERNGTSCAPCHVSQGFLERMANGTQSTEESIPNPNPVNCYSCHNTHSTYTTDDWALTYTSEVDFWHTGENPSRVDFGKGNLCSNCHQSRVVSPWPAVGSTDIYEITNLRYGPHHGPMSNLLGGFGGYEVPGSKTYANSMHTTVPDACVTCHMADAYGIQAGGHVMNVAYEYHGHTELLQAGCISCHPDGIGDETHAAQEEVHAMLEALGAKLSEMKILAETGYLLGEDGENTASSSNPAKLTADEAGAFFNYKFVEEDRSLGVHNFKYTRALLTNSLESLTE